MAKEREKVRGKGQGRHPLASCPVEPRPKSHSLNTLPGANGARN